MLHYTSIKFITLNVQCLQKDVLSNFLMKIWPARENPN